MVGGPSVPTNAMPRQLDILALEPFFGGIRRGMLEALVRYSRHRWTVLKLPPRRIERRLTAAANWFSEQLSRHWVSRVDLLFTSEAMNLSSLLRLTPPLADYPSVVYFHDNQFPDLSLRPIGQDDPLDQVNLNTAQSATEIWFNSSYHRQTFFVMARSVVARYGELAARDPLPLIREKSRVVQPPVDLGLVQQVGQSTDLPPRHPRTVFVETRGAHMPLLNEAVGILRRQQGPAFNLVTVGPVDSLDPQVARTTVSEYDEAGQVRGMYASSVVVSARPGAPSDHKVIRAMAAGCRPILPDAGVYPELIPPALHESCLYAVDPLILADRIAVALAGHGPPWHPEAVRPAFKPFDAITQCRLIDERIDQIVAAHPPRKA